MRRWLASGLALILGWPAFTAAQAPGWDRPVQLGRPTAWAPAATLGVPVAADAPTPDAPVRPVAYQPDAPSPAAVVFRMQAADGDGSGFRPPDPPVDDRPARPKSSRYHNRTSFSGILADAGINREVFGRRQGAWFESDHCFEAIISPVTNPFLFEDPRALTELRPLYFFQTIPSDNPRFRGGNAHFYGAQFRVAVTDRLSFVMNKLGGVTITPDAASGLPRESGFAELWLGPKFTFLRNTELQALGAAGLTFQLPIGKAEVYQDTGDLSMTPYVSLAKNFLATRIGSFNAMDTFGYTIRTDGLRSDYFYNSFHLSWDVRNRHIFYPLVELHWFRYTRSGRQRNFGFEGRDLANIGSTGVGGTNNLNLAAGARLKLSEHLQFGAAAEFPLLDRRDMQQFRLTFDLILRY